MIENESFGRKEYDSPHGNGANDRVTKIDSLEKCKLFFNCSASLCPLDPEITNKIWLSEETETGEICRNPDFSNKQFIITQKKIKKALKKSNRERDDYFTYEMLDRDIVIKSGIEGIPLDPPDTVKNSEKWYKTKEKKWLSNHPIKKQISEAEVQRRANRMKMVQKTHSLIDFWKEPDSKGVINTPEPDISKNPISQEVFK